ncbi:hypothetical protein MSBRW_2348 [Methanosarcina barkeri str. Wiesmoor]|uniref:Uncharacterized protein n=1 Tax=Methanosarcina barkeri str. Wiesmoor TaxID=1434109 RepID=A0A0E3LLN9_METBA|nr:hypothetical protein MSBRW_2348 [Methanosarcina barkeri str. Wiesmoor]
MKIRGNRSFQRQTSANQELSTISGNILLRSEVYTSLKDTSADPVDAAIPMLMMMSRHRAPIKRIFL